MVKNLYQSWQKQVKEEERKKKNPTKTTQNPHTQIFFKTHMESLKLHLYQINLGGLSIIKHAERVPIKKLI